MPPLPAVLIVVTSHAELGSTGRKTGYWLSEVTHFHHAISARGFPVDIASPRGGAPPLDEKSRSARDAINQAFLADPALRGKLEGSLALPALDPGRYAAIYLAGGHGAMWDFPDDAQLASIAGNIHRRGGVVSAVCHGSAGLLQIRAESGALLIAGRRVTGFSTWEERLIGLTRAVPFLLEDRLRDAGGLYRRAFIPFAPHLEEDGQLVTGQNPGSAQAVGKRVGALLAARTWS
jgi:putative intracellular protease/amidase